MKFNRIIVIVTDSVGAGDAPDAENSATKEPTRMATSTPMYP